MGAGRRGAQVHECGPRRSRGRATPGGVTALSLGRGVPARGLRCSRFGGARCSTWEHFWYRPSWIVTQTAADRRLGVGPRGVHRRSVPGWNGPPAGWGGWTGMPGGSRETGSGDWVGRPGQAGMPGGDRVVTGSGRQTGLSGTGSGRVGLGRDHGPVRAAVIARPALAPSVALRQVDEDVLRLRVEVQGGHPEFASDP